MLKNKGQSVTKTIFAAAEKNNYSYLEMRNVRHLF
jgi:hypothetical protein